MPRPRLVRLIGALLLGSALVGCAGPVALFDGHSLAGWEVTGEVQWSVSEQAIVASGSGDGFLATSAVFEDFYLRLEFWVDDSLNSGVFARCTDRSYIHPDTCYEFNIWDKHPRQEARTGAIVFQVMPPLAHVDTVGRWNTYEITARGPLLEARVNGVTTAVLETAGVRPGFIALQHVGEGTVKFRNIELRAL